MNVSKELKEEILQELQSPRYQEGDISIKDAMESLGLSSHGVRARLDKLVKEGTLLKLKGILPNGYVGLIYRPISKDD
jgi:predicted ArsR family transcriptional regulator